MTSCKCFPLSNTPQIQKKYQYSKIDGNIPIIYSSQYDITLSGLEKLHPFDTQKYSKSKNYLIRNSSLQENQFYVPRKATEKDILKIHTKDYLQTLNDPKNIAKIAELFSLASLPIRQLKDGILKPMLFATGGTLLATELSLDYGWSINLSGGYHHAKKDQGSGFCFYNDISIAVKKLFEKNPKIIVLIIDLDVHQGNGIADTVGNIPGVFIFDIYNREIFPRDEKAKKYIDFNFPVKSTVTEKEYLTILKKEIPEALKSTDPDLIIYNAGTDIFENDKIGNLDISFEGVIKRDQIVFNNALEQKIPITMVLSGGYSRESYRLIGKSIENIYNKWPEIFKY
ncbi:MAG: histone deacetylase family protein [Elusimicrobiota bacterium]